MAVVAQPSGTVTLVFTDIEGSTRLLEELGTDAYRAALAEHRRVVRDACARYQGYEVDFEGDAFFYAFSSAQDAVTAVGEAMVGLKGGPIRVRVGIHTGEPALDPPKYVGMDVHRAARIMASAHGGQVLVSASTAALTGTDRLRDLGEHRFKDLAAPERVYQLGAGEFPLLRTLHQTNLPIPQTPFLGREEELATVVGLLSRDDVRLLTLTGPGGTGKTRLGLQAAGALAGRYPHGVFWVSLASLRDPALVLESAAQVLGARDGLATYIGDKQLLLLFDNLDHLTGAAPDLSTVLGECPHLEILATSREPLRLSGEQEYPVPTLAAEEGVGLFLARARGIRPDFETDDTIPEICRRLDQLPLALELAAARTRSLSSAQILERLSQRLDLLRGGRDADPRQQTLRATVEWSHDLLSGDEQQLFAHLAVFAGGSTLDAAEHVCEADLDDLESLVAKSLLRFTNQRYWMLETIHQYAVEQLTASDEAPRLLERHAEHFRSLAEVAPRRLDGPDQMTWLDRLGPEEENFRQALDHFERTQAADSMLGLCTSLSAFWLIRGVLVEGESRFLRALSLDGADPTVRAAALVAAAWFPWYRGDQVLTRELAEEAIGACQAVGDVRGEGEAMNALAAATEGESGLALLEESIPLFRRVEDGWGVSRTLINLAVKLTADGEYVTAISHLEEALAIARERGDSDTATWALFQLGLLSALEGDDEAAREPLQECARAWTRRGDSRSLEGCFVVLARIAARAGDPRRAAIVLGAAAHLRERDGFSNFGSEAEIEAETHETARSSLGVEAFARALAEGRAMSVEEALDAAATVGARRCGNR